MSLLFVQKAKKIHNNKYDYSLSKYINTITKIEIICNEHGSFWQTPKDHLKGRGCPKCCGKNLSFQDMEKECRKVHNDKYEYLNFFNKGRYKFIKIKCKFHGEFIQRYSHHLSGHGCSECSGNTKKKNEKFISQSNLLHNNEYEYLSDYISTHEKVFIRHKKCGYEFYQEAKSHAIIGQGCPKCKKKSLGEEKIKKILIEKQIKFEVEKTFENCKDKYKLRYDFYLPEHNMLIEYDGKQHFTSRNVWGGEKALEEIKKKDKIKDEFAKQQNINLVRFNYTQFYKLEKVLIEVL